jgi:hypothetical protein
MRHREAMLWKAVRTLALERIRAMVRGSITRRRIDKSMAGENRRRLSHIRNIIRGVEKSEREDEKKEMTRTLTRARMTRARPRSKTVAFVAKERPEL